MGTESVNKWSCLHFSLAVSEAAEQTVGPLCWNGEWTPVPSECPLWLWGYQTYVSSVLCLHYSSYSLARKLAMCARQTLLVRCCQIIP